MNRINKILITVGAFLSGILILSIVMKTTTTNSIEKIAARETQLALQLSNDGVIKNSIDLNNYISQMEEYLLSNKSNLKIWKIYCNSDSITIVLYTGVHYTILPQVEGQK